MLAQRRKVKEPLVVSLQDFADALFHLVREKYWELAGGSAPMHARHKALAGIIMTRGMATTFSFTFIDLFIQIE